MLQAPFLLKNMNELITSAVFLTASLYGGGQVAGAIQAQPVLNDAPANIQATTSESTFKTGSSAQATSADTSAMEAYLRGEFGDKDAILVDIARCESNFHQFDTEGNVITRVNTDKNKTRDIGVMQINAYYQGDTAKKLGYDIYTVEGNAAYAKHLYEQEGTAPWSSSEKCWAGDIAKN